MMPLIFARTDKRQIVDLEITQIRPSENQPRRTFSERGLSELAASVSEHGVLQPVLVTKEQDGYSLVAGERRWRAAKLAGLSSVPAIIIERDSRECAQIALIENIQREQLSFFEEAAGYERLMREFGMTQTEIAQKVGKKQSTVANKLRLLKLPPTAQVMIVANGLTERHARELLRIHDRQQLFYALDRIITKKLNVSQSEQFIDSLQNGEKQPRRMCRIADLRIYVNTITKAVNMIKKAGIKPVTELTEHDGFVEYIIRIPKTGQGA